MGSSSAIVRLSQPGWLSLRPYEPPCRWPPTATMLPAFGIVKVLARFATLPGALQIIFHWSRGLVGYP